MPDRTIVLATNGRHGARGVTCVNPQEFMAYQDEDDALTYVIDYSAYLDGATIASVTRTNSGVTSAATSNTTTRVTQRLSNFGYIDIAVVTSTGDTDSMRITIRPRAGFQTPNDFRAW